MSPSTVHDASSAQPDIRGVVTSPLFLTTVGISFLFILGVSIVAPILPVLVDEFSITRAEAGLVLSSFAVGRLLFDFIGGMLADRFGIRRMAVFACLITLLGSLVAGLVPVFGWILGARVLQGIGSALYMTAAMGVVMDLAPPGGIGRLLSIHQGMIFLGVSFGPTVGGVVAGVWGYQGTFLLYAGFAGLGVLLSAWLLPSGRASRRPGDAGDGATRWQLVRRLLANPSFIIALVAAFALFWLRSGIRTTVLPLFAAERFGFSEAVIGAVLTTAAVGNLVVLWHAGRSVDRSGRRKVLLRSLAATAVAVALFALITESWLVFAAAAALGVVTGYSGVVPAAVVADLADVRIRRTAVGIQRTVTDLGLFVGPVTAGALADALGYGSTFLVAGLAVGLVALVTLFMRETMPAAGR